MIRKAQKTDIDSISAIYGSIHDEEEQGKVSIGWIRSVYPTRETALEALKRDDLFVFEENGQVLASAIINQVQPDAYAEGKWAYPADDSEVMVLHTLTVDPQAGGHGVGRAFVAYYEAYAREHKCPYLRMDTNQINAAARRLYAKLGYNEVDVVPCVFNGIPDVQLVLLEKKIGL